MLFLKMTANPDITLKCHLKNKHKNHFICYPFNNFSRLFDPGRAP